MTGRTWTTRRGRRFRVEDMSTEHLINSVALIARNQLRRKHGVRGDPLDSLSLSDDDLSRWFGTMMAELDFRLRRKEKKRGNSDHR